MIGNGEPFNPLDTRNLAEAVARALLERPVHALPPEARQLSGGIYAIYYNGEHPLYVSIANRNRGGRFELPIYVGKAIPAGSRSGGGGLTAGEKADLLNRLKAHARNISATQNLDLRDFQCRYLVVDPVWIPLAEGLLIRRFAPLWNTTLSGFGNNAVGGKRLSGKRSRWDVIHPGRPGAATGARDETEQDIVNAVQQALRARPA
jgi:hypothetical protein